LTELLRQAHHRYEDPLSRVWISGAERLGFRIERTSQVYASSDGRGTIYIGTDETLDADDSLAQMILHELCHALVEGETGQRQVDWGLGNHIGQNPWREHACLHLQAYLASWAGLRDFFAPTTDFRMSFWASLPRDPFFASPETGGRRERSGVAARIGAWRASRYPWAPHLWDALKASASIAMVVVKTIDIDASMDSSSVNSPCIRTDREKNDQLPSLWQTVTEPPELHPTAHAPIAPYYSEFHCADCAWVFTQRGLQRCQQAPGYRLAGTISACMRFEPANELDCQTCGACCREAYHSVEIEKREAVVRRYPDFIIHHDTRLTLRREGPRCAALSGGHSPTEPYCCSIYDSRPRTCHEFAKGSAHCLDARRRVGLSL
jgi:hypothetical protein